MPVSFAPDLILHNGKVVTVDAAFSIAIEDGGIVVSDAPGWGVEIAPQWLAKSTYQCSEVQP